MAAPQRSQALMLWPRWEREGGRREGFPRLMSAAHTDPSLVTVVPLFFV